MVWAFSYDNTGLSRVSRGDDERIQLVELFFCRWWTGISSIIFLKSPWTFAPKQNAESNLIRCRVRKSERIVIIAFRDYWQAQAVIRIFREVESVERDACGGTIWFIVVCRININCDLGLFLRKKGYETLLRKFSLIPAALDVNSWGCHIFIYDTSPIHAAPWCSQKNARPLLHWHPPLDLIGRSHVKNNMAASLVAGPEEQHRSDLHLRVFDISPKICRPFLSMSYQTCISRPSYDCFITCWLSTVTLLWIRLILPKVRACLQITSYVGIPFRFTEERIAGVKKEFRGVVFMCLELRCEEELISTSNCCCAACLCFENELPLLVGFENVGYSWLHSSLLRTYSISPDNPYERPRRTTREVRNQSDRIPAEGMRGGLESTIKRRRLFVVAYAVSLANTVHMFDIFYTVPLLYFNSNTDSAGSVPLCLIVS